MGGGGGGASCDSSLLLPANEGEDLVRRLVAGHGALQVRLLGACKRKMVPVWDKTTNIRR